MSADIQDNNLPLAMRESSQAATCWWKNKSRRPSMSSVYPTLGVQLLMTCNDHTGQGASPYRLVSIASAVKGQSIAYQSMTMAIYISNIICQKSKTLVFKAMNSYWQARVKRMCGGDEPFGGFLGAGWGCLIYY